MRGLVDEGKDVVILGHSFGGVVVGEAITPEFQKKDGKKGGVVGIIYLSSYTVPVGGVLFMLLGGEPEEFVEMHVRSPSPPIFTKLT